jgi:SAM-dependent methyltransferase
VSAEAWNHNGHYHRIVLGAVPPGCARALDVGCGQGGLTRQLRGVVPHVVGLDRDQRSIELSRAHPGAGDVGYVLGDFLGRPFRPASFDFIASVAALHHLDAESGLRQMAELLRPGGVLAIVGLATDASPLRLFREIPAIIADRLHLTAAALRRRRGSHRPGYQSPIVWPPPLSYRELRRLAERELPGASFRRRLYWRYTLTWTKPANYTTQARSTFPSS